MTANEALKSIPFWQAHPFITALIISVVIIVPILIHEYKKYGREDENFAGENVLVSMLTFFIVFTVIFNIVLFSGGAKGLNETQKANLLRTPVEQLSVNKTQLIGATSSGFTKSKISGSMFYLSGNTSDTTSYRYVTNSDKGYQIATLSDHYGDINPNDVYVRQVQNKAQLVVVKQRFKNKDVRSLIDSYTKNDSEWTTYTFEVPNPKILNSFNFK